MKVALQTEQKQILSHRMMQSAEILQMASAQLEEYLQQQLLENPVLLLRERETEPEAPPDSELSRWTAAHDEQNRYLYQEIEAGEQENDDWKFAAPQQESLEEYLWQQIAEDAVPTGLKNSLKWMIASLDERGYFPESLGQWAEQARLPLSDAERLLQLVQSLEPAGVGARSLAECLCLQLRRRNLLTRPFQSLIENHLEDAAKNHLSVLAREMRIPQKQAAEYCRIIRTLDPCPGAPFFAPRQTSYLIPDILVIREGDRFRAVLNEQLCPDLSVNQDYLNRFRNYQDAQLKTYLSEKVKQAEWVRQCVRQRYQTVLSVAQFILSVQQDFFRGLPLRPLLLADAAKSLGIHESTVSRAVRGKYLQCAAGVFPLSSFFVKAAPQGHRQETAGAPASVDAVKNAIQELLRQENPQKPFSDRVLSELLARQGYSISRRTVAKYREEMKIPDASGRKAI